MRVAVRFSLWRKYREPDLSTVAGADAVASNYPGDVGLVAGVFGVIACLVSGRLFGKPVERTSKAGRQFATAKLRVASADGESLFVGVVAFSSHVIEALLALDPDDNMALSGTLKAGAYADKDGTPRPSLDIVASQILTAYAVGKKRKAVAQREAAPAEQLELPSVATADVAESAGVKEPEFDDAIPF